MKKNKIIIIIFIAVGIVLFGFLGYKAYNDFFKNKSNTKKLDSLELYGYTLTTNDTDIYKSEFENLRAVLNNDKIDYEEYAKSISKLFIIDLYTLDNKLGSTDIGGTEYIYHDFVDNFSLNMGSTLYKNIEANLNNTRTQKLPIVSEVIINDIKPIEYKFNEKETNGYEVNVSWKYEEDLGYQNKMKLTLMETNKKLYVVKGE